MEITPWTTIWGMIEIWCGEMVRSLHRVCGREIGWRDARCQFRAGEQSNEGDGCTVSIHTDQLDGYEQTDNVYNRP